MLNEDLFVGIFGVILNLQSLAERSTVSPNGGIENLPLSSKKLGELKIKF